MSNVYRIGVALALSSNSSQVLGALSRHLLHVHGQVGQLKGGFDRLKVAIGGALAVAGGVTVITAFRGPLEEARKLEQVVAKFSTFGLGDKLNRDAVDFAKNMKVAGSTYVDNMNRIIEAQGVFRESGLTGPAALRGAKLAAPVLAKIDFANAALDEESRARQHTSAMAMLRFIEMRGGVNSPEKFNAIADAGFKAIRSSGGNIDWENLRQFTARAGVSGMQLTNEALFGKLEPIIGELKGATAGTALMTAYNRLMGINSRGMGPVANDLIKMGVWDPRAVQLTPEGNIKRFHRNPFMKADMFAHDPIEFYEKVVRPYYDSKGMNMVQRDRQNALIFGRTGGAMFSLADRQSVAIHHSVDAQRKAMGIDQAVKAAGGTLSGKLLDYHAKFTNLMERLGEAVLPIAVKGLEILVPALEKMTAWAAAHPKAVAFFAKTALVVAGALIGLGTAALAVAAFAAAASGGAIGLIVAGVSALVGAVAAFIVVNWDHVKAAATKLFEFVKIIVNASQMILFNPGGFLKGLAPKGLRAVTAEEAARSNANPLSAPLSAGDRVFDLSPRGWKGIPYLPPGGRASAVPPPKARKEKTSGDVFLDGRKVGDILWRHQDRDMERASRSGGGGIDPGMTLSPVGLGYA